MLDASPGAEATVLDGDRGWRGDPCATAEVHPGSPHRADGAGEKGEKVGDAKEISLASQRLRVPRATVVRLVCYGPESTTSPLRPRWEIRSLSRTWVRSTPRHIRRSTGVRRPLSAHPSASQMEVAGLDPASVVKEHSSAGVFFLPGDPMD
ncbi:hypothetical protein VUR80DRAFT_1609 [Thermomyces stellatus]